MEYRTNAAQSLVFSLPYNHRILLQYMISFFHRITSTENKNFMQIEYVCDFWGIIFFRPPKDKKDDAWDKKTSTALSKLILEQDLIFPVPLKKKKKLQFFLTNLC